MRTLSHPAASSVSPKEARHQGIHQIYHQANEGARIARWPMTCYVCIQSGEIGIPFFLGCLALPFGVATTGTEHHISGVIDGRGRLID